MKEPGVKTERNLRLKITDRKAENNTNAPLKFSVKKLAHLMKLLISLKFKKH